MNGRPLLDAEHWPCATGSCSSGAVATEHSVTRGSGLYRFRDIE
jgi:hypothetical protein